MKSDQNREKKAIARTLTDQWLFATYFISGYRFNWPGTTISTSIGCLGIGMTRQQMEGADCGQRSRRYFVRGFDGE